MKAEELLGSRLGESHTTMGQRDLNQIYRTSNDRVICVDGKLEGDPKRLIAKWLDSGHELSLRSQEGSLYSVDSKEKER